MSKSFASFVSYLFHPGFMPTYLLAILYFVSPYIMAIEGYAVLSRLLILFFVFLYTFLFPVLIIFWLYKRGSVSSMKLEKLNERRIPYLVTIISLGFLSYFFYTKSTMLQPSGVVLGFILLALIWVAVVSWWWQVSVHATGIGGVVGALFTLTLRFDEPNLHWPFLFSLLVAGLVCSARLRLNAHTPFQIFTGFLGGLLTGLVGSLYI